jgi:hypothetical protein
MIVSQRKSVGIGARSNEQVIQAHCRAAAGDGAFGGAVDRERYGRTIVDLQRVEGVKSRRLGDEIKPTVLGRFGAFTFSALNEVVVFCPWSMLIPDW